MFRNSLKALAAAFFFGILNFPAYAEQTGLDSLTPSYLEGRWCYAYIDIGGQREDMAVEYVFATDGTLQYQTSSLSDRMSDGSYELGDGKIKIKPALMFFNFEIQSIDEAEFVLSAMGGMHHFTRGDCG